MAIGQQHIITGRYYNCNGYATAIVAVVTEGIDWAAYIGGADPRLPKFLASQWVAQMGDKLSKSDALYYFPKERYPELDLPYRL